jgi:branched-subunit amino acid permease
MSAQRIFGIVLLVIGVVLLVVGMNASHSAADQVSNTFTGRFTHETALYIFGGGAAALLGLLMFLPDVLVARLK